MARGYKPSEEIITTGERKGLIVIRDGRVTYKATEKSYDFGDPEEPVRTKIYIELIEKYKYPKNRIDTEVMPPRREPKLPADIVVYEDDEKEKIFIVVETKATSTETEIEIGK